MAICHRLYSNFQTLPFHLNFTPIFSYSSFPLLFFQSNMDQDRTPVAPQWDFIPPTARALRSLGLQRGSDFPLTLNLDCHIYSLALG